MPHPCPRTCGRLATAAIFVSVSVVQFIAGLILLKSRYLYLLSGPDFWTAASNLAVGILLGVSAGVWKDVQKTSGKHIVRRNILASLVASAITINSTTAIILILGEGNALLSIQLENDGNFSSKSEILAYSYATSVCSPIVSVVVAIVFLSGMWFRVNKKGQKTPEIKSILKKDSFNDFNWVFKPSQSPNKPYSRTIRKELSFKSLSSSDDESFNATDAKMWSNSVYSIEYLDTLSRKGTHKSGMNRHSKIHQELACESGESFPGRILHGTNQMGLNSDTKTIKFLKSSSYARKMHLENDYSFYPDQIEERENNVGSISFEEFKKHSRKMPKPFNSKKRMSLTEHPVFQQFKHLDGSVHEQNFHKSSSPEAYIPRVQARMINKSKFSTPNVKSDVYMNPKSRDWVGEESTSESPAHCKGNVSYNEVLNEILRHKNAKFQRTSTSKYSLKSVASHPKENITDRKVFRTSTTADPSSPKIPNLDISDIQYDSVIDQNESHVFEDEKEVSNLSTTPCNYSPQPTTSQVDAYTEVGDSSINIPQSNAENAPIPMLAGEVVRVRVNSLPLSAFHSKLVPVPIPVVSSFKNKTWSGKQGELFTKATNKFSDGNESGHSSFHDELMVMKKGNRHSMADREVHQKHKTVYDGTICEMTPDNNYPPSPAHTSGYDSTIFENSHLSECEFLKPKLSSSVTNSPYYTPKKKFHNYRPPRNLNNLQ